VFAIRAEQKPEVVDEWRGKFRRKTNEREQCKLSVHYTTVEPNDCRRMVTYTAPYAQFFDQQHAKQILEKNSRN
jgi:hypothetical protein